MFLAFYNAVFYRPIFNLLMGIHAVVPGHDIGIAIIVLTVIVKVVLWPVSASAMRSQKALADLQPKVEELKKKYPRKEDKEELSKELMALYSREKVNPASSCLPLLIQLPVFIALYRAMIHGLASEGFDQLYAFVPSPGAVTPTLLGFVDLAANSLPLAVLAGAMQFVQAKMMVTKKQPPKTPGGKDEQMLATMNRQMMYVMPVVTVIIGMKLPGGLTLYWFVMNVLTVVQQRFFLGEKKDGAKAEPAAAS